MGSSEEGKPCKPEKPSSPAPDQTNMHMYPDWAAMQAYYGPRVAVPPYFNSAVAPGHAPPHPYMWGPPQAMMPPYGAPYAALYAHGGVYVHPGVSLAATPPSTEAPGKSPGNIDRGLMKKLKGFDGLAMSIGNGNTDSAEGGAEHEDSLSAETEGSSEGSDGNTAGASLNSRKRSREGTPTLGGDGKNERHSSLVPVMETNGASDKVNGATVTPSVAGKVIGTVLSSNMTTTLELGNPSADPKISPTRTPQPCAMIPNEAWFQDERELKREKRKQSNRESARRSRLRKQAETEELSVRVDSLTAENTTLKSEINRLTENSEKLKLENASLVEKLKNGRIRQTKNGIPSKIDKKAALPSTENLLSRVNNSGYVDRSEEENNGTYDSNKKSGSKLHQLLDASPRTDAVAAG